MPSPHWHRIICRRAVQLYRSPKSHREAIIPRMNAVTAPVISQPFVDVPSRVDAERLPGHAYVALLALACLPIGISWDISWHISIGRDTFWTPAHIVIQVGGVIPALLFAIQAFRTTFYGTPDSRAATVSMFGARAPLGAWVTMWGSLAMLTSA